VNILGSKKMSGVLKKRLYRNSKREMRNRDTTGTVLEKYNTLVDSFDKTNYAEYENLHRKWGTPGRKRQVMLDIAIKENIQGPVRELAELRVNDLSEHQKILQILRYRWLNKKEYEKEKVNNDSELFWKSKAIKMLRGDARRKIEISKTWDVPELTSFLKKLYEKQNGKCAISGMPLELQIGTGKPNPNKCSVDRIDSNRGYNHRNVWLVCWWVNQMKMDMSMETFNERIKILYEVQNKQ
jgi:hypothetical protein